jgi:hypothetical protein
VSPSRRPTPHLTNSKTFASVPPINLARKIRRGDEGDTKSSVARTVPHHTMSLNDSLPPRLVKCDDSIASYRFAWLDSKLLLLIASQHENREICPAQLGKKSQSHSQELL